MVLDFVPPLFLSFSFSLVLFILDRAYVHSVLMMPPPKAVTHGAREVTGASELMFVMWSSVKLIILSVSGRASHPGGEREDKASEAEDFSGERERGIRPVRSVFWACYSFENWHMLHWVAPSLLGRGGVGRRGSSLFGQIEGRVAGG